MFAVGSWKRRRENRENEVIPLTERGAKPARSAQSHILREEFFLYVFHVVIDIKHIGFVLCCPLSDL